MCVRAALQGAKHQRSSPAQSFSPTPMVRRGHFVNNLQPPLPYPMFLHKTPGQMGQFGRGQNPAGPHTSGCPSPSFRVPSVSTILVTTSLQDSYGRNPVPEPFAPHLRLPLSKPHVVRSLLSAASSCPQRLCAALKATW